MTVRQAQSPFHEGREHQLILEAGSSGLTPRRYVEIAAGMNATGPQMARALLLFQRTGQVPEGFDASQIGALHSLMFTQEALRSPAALAQAQMSTELLAMGESPGRVFGTDPARGGLFPMSAEGAQARARSVDEALARPDEAGRRGRRERERQMRREVALIRAWVRSLDIEFKPGASQREEIEEIKSQIRSRLRRAFGLPA